MHIKIVENDAEWEQARAIRERVFVEEQRCPPEEEWDAYDASSRHLLGIVEGRAVATARWRVFPFEERLAAKLERFAVLPECRGKGYGRALVDFALHDARRAGFQIFYLHAQAHLEAFYATFGFRTVGTPFMEANIPHIAMVRNG